MVNSIRRDNDIKCPDCKGVLHVTIRKSLTETSVLTGVKADNSVWVRIPISEKSKVTKVDIECQKCGKKWTRRQLKPKKAVVVK